LHSCPSVFWTGKYLWDSKDIGSENVSELRASSVPGQRDAWRWLLQCLTATLYTHTHCFLNDHQLWEAFFARLTCSVLHWMPVN
jgi:hypothetical protein